MEQKSNSLSRVKRHQSEKVLRFSIRKYSFGAVSVAVAALMFLGTHGVSADNIEVKPDGVTADVVDNKVGEGKATNVLVDDSRTAEVANATTENTGTPVAFGNKVEQPKDTVVPNSVEAPNLKQQKADTVDKTKLSKVVGELSQLLDSKKTLKSSVVSLIKVRLLKAQVLLNSSDAVQGDIDSLAETLSNDFTTLSSLKDEELQNKEHSNNAEDGSRRVEASAETSSSANGKDKLNASVAELEAAVLELPEDESTKEVLGKAKELLSLAQSTLANTTVAASEVEDLTGRVKRMFNSVKIATLRLTSGSHDPRNGRNMGVGSQFRADSSTTSGALTNIKYFASVNPRGTTRNNNPELTKTKTDIKSYYVQDSEGKWIVYDVFFNNNARRIVSPGQKQHYYFQLPFNIMDSSNTVRDLTFTRYRSVGGTTDGFDGFVQHGNEARISQGEVFAGQKDRIFNNDRYTMYDPNSGAYSDDRKRQVFKSNANDQTLNTAVRDTNGNYPRASYYLGLDIAPGENLDYAIHMHAKVKLKKNVTEAEANRYGRVFAATVGEQIASNESYVMYGTTALTPRDTTPPTITANNATVTKNEAIPAISVTAVDNNGGVGMRTTKPIEVTGLPTGLSYANNQITGTPTAAKGNYNVTIKAYDKNNNPATKNIVITVQEQTAKYNPTGAELTVNQNHTLTDAEITGKVSCHGPGTLTVVSKPATAIAGNAGNAVVRVTYPDTSTDTVNVPIKVKDVTGPSITANGATVTKNEPITPIPVTVTDNTGGRGLREENPVQVTGLPTGLSYANNQITGTPTASKGDYSVTITAYDKDGNPTTETITIKVQEQTDKYNPTGEELTVDQNHVLTDAEITAKVKDFGPGTLTVESKPSTATVGDAGNAVVKVTYPDGSSDTVNVPVKVRDVTGPSITANGATVTKDEPITPIPVTVTDNTGGRGLREENPVQVTGLPTGLSYANNQITGTPTASKGDYSVTITAYDKDGNPTTETITIKVQEQTDKYNPKYDDGQGKPETKVEIPVTEETGKPIPEGTKFESATPGITVDDKGKVTVTIPEDKNPGDEITGKVTVTYPDGSKEEIPVKVTVTAVSKNGGVPVPIELPEMTIIIKWIDEDGKELKPSVKKVSDGTEAINHGSIPGYVFVRTEIDEKELIITHIFRKESSNTNIDSTPITPMTPNTNENRYNTRDDEVKPKDSQNVLPNTGTESSATLATLGIIGVLSGFGLVAGKKKEE